MQSLLVLAAACSIASLATAGEDLSRFTEASKGSWDLAWSATTEGDWSDGWFLDGKRARVIGSPGCFIFEAGPVALDHGSHAVLWTRLSFAGDIRIEFDYTRLDTINQFVNILYIQATGTGEEPYVEDIAEWAHLREIPYMRTYFRNMNLLHISYAAFGVEGPYADHEDYVRARRYPVSGGGNFSKETEIPPSYEDTGLFRPGQTCHITVLKTETNLFFHVRDRKSGDERLFAWETSAFPLVTEGRIGLRHMWTRAAKYENFRVYRRENP